MVAVEGAGVVVAVATVFTAGGADGAVCALLGEVVVAAGTVGVVAGGVGVVAGRAVAAFVEGVAVVGAALLAGIVTTCCCTGMSLATIRKLSCAPVVSRCGLICTEGGSWRMTSGRSGERVRRMARKTASFGRERCSASPVRCSGVALRSLGAVVAGCCWGAGVDSSSEVLIVSPAAGWFCAARLGDMPSMESTRARKPADELSSRMTTSLPLRSLKLVCNGRSPCSVRRMGLP